MNRIKNNLMVKMTLMTCLLVLIVVAGIGGISYYWSSKAVTQEVELKLQAELNGVKSKFALKLESTENMLELVGDTPTLKGLNKNDLIVETPRKRNARKLLENMIAQKGDLLESIYITDSKGMILIDSNKGEHVGIDLSNRTYFKWASEGVTNWSDILESKFSGHPIRVYAYPLHNEFGQSVGVLAAAVKMESFFSVLEEIKVGENGYAYMIDSSGRFVYHPDETIMMQKRVEELEIAALTEVLPKMLEGEDGRVFYTLEGISKLNLFTGLEDYSISLNADQAEYLSGLYEMRNQMLLFGVLFFVLGIVFAGSIAYYIVKRIRRMQSVMKAAAAGDLTVEFTSKGIRPQDGDEVIQMGMSLNAMIDGFSDLINQIMRTAETLSTSSQQLSASAEEGGQSAEEVTANIEEITAGSEEQSKHVDATNAVVLEMKNQLDLSSASTDQMVEESILVLEKANEGQSQMGKTIKQMDAILISSEQTLKVIQALNEQSSDIGVISDTISNIADQTNLLALNASIEAARAGEQGRGFAVVAEEIRKLATESMESATGINALIGQIQSEITMASSLIQAENSAIHEGLGLVQHTDAAFHAIHSRVESTNTLIEEVASTIRSSGVYGDQVTQAMDYIRQVSLQSVESSQAVSASAEEQNAVAQEIASASDQLSNMAQDLLAHITQFKV